MDTLYCDNYCFFNVYGVGVQMKSTIKRKWNDFYCYVVYQGQQDYYKYPFHKRIVPALDYILIDLITLPIRIFGWFYIKYIM